MTNFVFKSFSYAFELNPLHFCETILFSNGFYMEGDLQKVHTLVIFGVVLAFCAAQTLLTGADASVTLFL